MTAYIAKKYFKYLDETNFITMDLIQYDNMGLINAIKAYDINDTSFSTWASILISIKYKMLY